MAEFVEDRLWQRHQPLRVSLANDTQHLVGSIDGADRERGSLADAQAARAYQIARHVL